MLLKNFKILIAIISITIYWSRSEATKCGDFFCEGNVECLFDEHKHRLECACAAGFMANITGNIYHCYQALSNNVAEKCLKVGDKCGPEHTCSPNLICEKTNIIDLAKCAAGAEKCLDKCCQADEVCLEGKCVIRPPPATQNIECPETWKCLAECCAENEVCSAENVCVLRDESLANEKCVESQKCLDKCCQENEVCENGNKCVAKKLESSIDQCPESQKCQDKCCKATETCQDENKCIDEQSTYKECPLAQICLDICCNDTEKCSKEYKCIAKEKLEYENTYECPVNQTCFGVCCAENEICGENNKCLPSTVLSPKCPEPQKCLDMCCSPTQFCSKDFECLDAFAVFSTAATIPTLSTSYPPLRQCPLTKQCLNTCCGDQEKCSKFNVCIPINTIECIETEICGDKCCPINETCNQANECVAFVEATPMDGCAEKQRCLDKCCHPSEICNELYHCVKEETFNYDILYTELSVTEPNFDTTVQLFGLKSQEQSINCVEDYLICGNKCCKHDEFCSATGECTKDVAETRTSLSYTLIGLGSLVMVLSFALFKVYSFRRSTANLY